MPEDRKKYWVGFDLGGTKMMAKVFDAEFRVVARDRRKTKAHEGAEAGLQRIAGSIHDALQKAGLSSGALAGIGCGVPGPLDLDKGILLELPNLGWKNVQMRKALEQEFGCSTVICNDVDAGTYGEYRFGAGKGARSVLGVFPGTGIGGGFIYDGKILRGRNYSCMEIGHCQVVSNGAVCGCGRRGCLETVASRLSIAAAAASAAHRGEAPHLAAAVGMDLSRIKSGALAAAIAEGDKAVEQIVRDAAQWLGIAIAGAVNLLAPDVVVLGGGMVEAMPDLFLKEAGDAAMARVMPSFQKTFKVCIAQLGDDATALGAAAWAEAGLKAG